MRPIQYIRPRVSGMPVEERPVQADQRGDRVVAAGLLDDPLDKIGGRRVAGVERTRPGSRLVLLGLRLRKSRYCWVRKAVAVVHGANVAGRDRWIAPWDAASRLYFALTACAWYQASAGLRISKWQCGDGGLGVAAVAEVGDELALADAATPTAMPGANAHCRGLCAVVGSRGVVVDVEVAVVPAVGVLEIEVVPRRVVLEARRRCRRRRPAASGASGRSGPGPRGDGCTRHGTRHRCRSR